MKYWLCVTTEENWGVIKEKNVWGVPERYGNVIQRVESGDKLVFYLMQVRKGKEVVPSRVAGGFEVVSEPYRDEEAIFKDYRGNRIFPHRVKIRPITIFEKTIAFKDLVPKLTFIKNKRFWTGYLRRAMVAIPEKDYKLLSQGE